ncbi:MAG: DUF4082 domain-containing protein, partial [Acidobacteriota bacterium]|nr:DUF4082 domain-containing protein [Acidobacteriota bacterium]
MKPKKVVRINTQRIAAPLVAALILSFAASVCAQSTIFSSTSVPAEPSASDSNAIEVGVKFQSAVSGYIKGIRFYKGPANTGTHIGHLWTSTGTLLGTVTFTNETATGWQEADFAAPIAITANTTYVASYHTDTGGYGRSVDYFSNGPASNPPLAAPSASAAGGNGVFNYGADAFPNDTFSGSNYWVDVDFTQNAAPAPPAAESTIFSSTSVPAEPSASDSSAIEVGVKFQSAVSGYIKGIRFYKGPANTGTHIGHL